MPRAQAATTRGFLIADVIWALPLLVLATLGIWHPRPWGWTAAQMVNILWLYSVTVVLIRDLYTGMLSPGTVCFLPFALFSLWAAVHLWRHRGLFWSPGPSSRKSDLPKKGIPNHLWGAGDGKEYWPPLPPDRRIKRDFLPSANLIHS